MTNEEAIKYLIQPIVSSTDVGEEKQKEIDAYNMAIKALERQKDISVKCEKCPYGKIVVRHICNYGGHGCGWD